MCLAGVGYALGPSKVAEQYEWDVLSRLDEWSKWYEQAWSEQ